MTEYISDWSDGTSHTQTRRVKHRRVNAQERHTQLKEGLVMSCLATIGAVTRTITKLW